MSTGWFLRDSHSDGATYWKGNWACATCRETHEWIYSRIRPPVNSEFCFGGQEEGVDYAYFPWISKRWRYEGNGSRAPPINSYSSESQMAELVISEGGVVERKAIARGAVPRRPSGSTIHDATENDPTNMGHMARSLISRQPVRRNSNGPDSPTPCYYSGAIYGGFSWRTPVLNMPNAPSGSLPTQSTSGVTMLTPLDVADALTTQSTIRRRLRRRALQM